MSEPSVAEQIEANAQAETVRTERNGRLVQLAPEDHKIVLDAGEFEGTDLSKDEEALLMALIDNATLDEPPEGDPAQEGDDEDDEDEATQEELEAAAEKALEPEAEEFDPNLDNPLDPKMTEGEKQEAESKLTEEEKKELIERQKKANRATLKNNRRAAKEWIARKTGVGILLGHDPDGRFHTLLLGDEESIQGADVQLDDPMYKLLLTLVLSHLPGASVNSQLMHADQMNALNNVGNNLMAGLQATNNNVLQLVAFLKLKFPELQTDVQAMHQTQSGLLVPSKG